MVASENWPVGIVKFEMSSMNENEAILEKESKPMDHETKYNHLFATSLSENIGGGSSAKAPFQSNEHPQRKIISAEHLVGRIR